MIFNASNLIPDSKTQRNIPLWILNPFARLSGYLLIILPGLFLLGQLVIPNISGLFVNHSIISELLVHLILSAFLISIYMLMIRKLEQRPVYEFSTSSLTSELAGGIFIGALLIGSVILILAFAGYYNILSFNSIENLLSGIIVFGYGAFVEELIFRLIIFKLIEEYFGSWISLIISALFFGMAHAFNDHATLWSALAIAIEAGILLSMAFIFTRRIWMILGIHFAWNFMQASVFGLPASGMEFPGLITAELSGPTWITGGDFGIEASTITIIFGLAISWLLQKKAYLDDQFILPKWRTRKKTEIRY